ncbi:MAG: redoxin domain-containing protein, partial [Myxococcota bacterium]|nr:redoxin domain-containing protein [Myxococcota bacterium]
MQNLARVATWKIIQAGEKAPDLSLTADEGTWVRLPDFKIENLNVVFVFFRSIHDESGDAWLKDYDQHLGQFEDLDATVFGV